MASFLCLPPVRLVSSGYGEVEMSIITVGLVPALAFIMQGHDFHQLLVMVVISLNYITYRHAPGLGATRLCFGYHPRKATTLLVRLGWQRGMMLHKC